MLTFRRRWTLPIKLWFYFNGFNSAVLDDYSGNPKITAVDEFARSRGFHFAPESICYRRARDHSEDVLGKIGSDAKEVVFCGSSMGGWFARIMQLMLGNARPGLRTATLAFNPAYDLGLHGHVLLGPQENHVTLERYTWTQAHGRQLKVLEDKVTYDSDYPFYVYADKGDEVIPWEGSAARHSGVSRFRVFEGGCHSFDHYREALRDFGSHFLSDSQMTS